MRWPWRRPEPEPVRLVDLPATAAPMVPLLSVDIQSSTTFDGESLHRGVIRVGGGIAWTGPEWNGAELYRQATRSPGGLSFWAERSSFDYDARAFAKHDAERHLRLALTWLLADDYDEEAS